jgi:2-polyprenyl-6-methoxyphenol hydroxylase-like FAD-dependent oxidoreductase
MNTQSSRGVDVLIVGAGPTGLVLALWLSRLGVQIRIIDKTAEPGTTSRALAVQARTLEFYRQIGIADAVVERGWRTAAVNLWVAGKRTARAIFGNIGEDISKYPFVMTFPQDEHEELLVDTLAATGIYVERNTELLRFEDSANGVVAHLKRPDGVEESCEAAYLAGCDGARSTVRAALGTGFPGGTYSHLFYVADVEASGETINGELHVALDRTDFLAVFPLNGEKRARLVGTVNEEVHRQGEDLSWNDVSKRVLDWIKIDVERVNWFSTYRVHHRVADYFRKGRVFMMGDAAHIHSPVGGQGMNTGIGDAVNLSWKLAAVLHGQAHPSMLDSYEPERIAFARRLVATTDQAFTIASSPSFLARLMRQHIAPMLIRPLFSLKKMRRLLFRTVSQTMVNYRESSLSHGHVGDVYGGDRLPWVKINSDGQYADNFAPLASLRWQLHVYGDVTTELRALCNQRNLQLQIFSWSTEMKRAGLQRNAAYLTRPDGYIALADAEASPAAIVSYLDARQLTFAS